VIEHLEIFPRPHEALRHAQRNTFNVPGCERALLLQVPQRNTRTHIDL